MTNQNDSWCLVSASAEFLAIAGNLIPIGVCTVFGAVIHRLDTWCDTLLPISTLTHHLDLVKMIPYFLNGTSIMGESIGNRFQVSFFGGFLKQLHDSTDGLLKPNQALGAPQTKRVFAATRASWELWCLPWSLRRSRAGHLRGKGWKFGVFLSLPGGIDCNPITPMLNISIVWSSLEISP